jgi:hypothetical protein
MKFLHEMMPIFRTEFSEFPRRGLAQTYKTGFTEPGLVSFIGANYRNKTNELTLC